MDSTTTITIARPDALVLDALRLPGESLDQAGSQLIMEQARGISAGREAIVIRLFPEEVTDLRTAASPSETVEAFAGRLVAEALARMEGVPNED